MNIAKVLALIATMHVQCPAELPQEGAGGDLDRTASVEWSDYARLCAAKPRAVACHGHQGVELTFADVARIDEAFRRVFRYRAETDDEYRWSNWSTCGECGDYALTLSELLAMAGEDGRDMMIVLIDQCDDTDCDGHMRLWVRTADRGLVEIDNQHGVDHPHWEEGEYQAFITLDGRRKAQPFPGWAINGDHAEWRGK